MENVALCREMPLSHEHATDWKFGRTASPLQSRNKADSGWEGDSGKAGSVRIPVLSQFP